jgi:hypothetical protein
MQRKDSLMVTGVASKAHRPRTTGVAIPMGGIA